MWIVYIRNDDLHVSEIKSETDANYYLKSNRHGHSQFNKNLQHRLFKDKEPAFAFYRDFYHVWKNHRIEMEVEVKGIELTLKEAKQKIKEYDKCAFDLIKEHPEEFI